MKRKEDHIVENIFYGMVFFAACRMVLLLHGNRR